MTTISAAMSPGMVPQILHTQGGDTGFKGRDVGEFSGSEADLARAISEAEEISAKAALTENIADMKLSMAQRQEFLQRKRGAIYEAGGKDMDAAWWRSASRIASSVLAMAAGGLALGSVAGGGRQMTKAAAEGSLGSMNSYSERGFKVDSWNKIGQTAQLAQQGLGGITTTIGEQNATSYDVEKRCQDLEGQMYDSDASVSMDMFRRRCGDATEAIKRSEKMNDARLEFLRGAMRVLG